MKSSRASNFLSKDAEQTATLNHGQKARQLSAAHNSVTFFINTFVCAAEPCYAEQFTKYVSYVYTHSGETTSPTNCPMHSSERKSAISGRKPVYQKFKARGFIGGWLLSDKPTSLVLRNEDLPNMALVPWTL